MEEEKAQLSEQQLEAVAGGGYVAAAYRVEATQLVAALPPPPASPLIQNVIGIIIL